ncbi:hypothetical protein [Kitasatospora sp. NPDC001683]
MHGYQVAFRVAGSPENSRRYVIPVRALTEELAREKAWIVAVELAARHEVTLDPATAEIAPR